MGGPPLLDTPILLSRRRCFGSSRMSIPQGPSMPLPDAQTPRKASGWCRPAFTSTRSRSKLWVLLLFNFVGCRPMVEPLNGRFPDLVLFRSRYPQQRQAHLLETVRGWRHFTGQGTAHAVRRCFCLWELAGGVGATRLASVARMSGAVRLAWS